MGPIPLVGEPPLADALRTCARLPRLKALVLAGSLMGGDIQRAVCEVYQQCLLVVRVNMAGSVPDTAYPVVLYPIQVGVMTVMAVAETANFSIDERPRFVGSIRKKPSSAIAPSLIAKQSPQI